MKTLILALLTIVSQQIEPELSPAFTIHDKITEAEKEKILAVVQATLNRYTDVGNFWDSENQTFDNRKYAEFITLFASSAKVVDDISFNKEELPYSTYAQKIFSNLQEIGVSYKLEKALINKIDIDETGFYVIDVSLTKRLFTGLNEHNKPVELKKGRVIHLNMRIDLPDYLLEDARIQYIQVENNNRVLNFIKKPIGYVSRLMKSKN
ncbi:hypothetical protein [Portibacter lacus]|uniref:Uncharacterized protein n=1 Tax=Portibacter lacus TaxID=1099794 RepID=A0AA37SNZ9_9BACT|nr:hypothetical protein [Portibacter lacus]GLR16128.1 hypothetical protein GCM10007940_07430 [Portibacter lacus]